MGQCAAVTLSNAAQQEELSLLRFSSKAGRGGGGSRVTERLNIYIAVACSRQCTSSSMDLNQTNIRTHFGEDVEAIEKEEELCVDASEATFI